MRPLTIALGLGLLLLPSVARAQGEPVVPRGWGNMVGFGRLDYSNTQDLNAVIMNKSTASCRLENGHAPGSALNSGLLSTDIPPGGRITIDLSAVTKSWGKPFGIVFNWMFRNVISVVLILMGLMMAFRLGASIVSKWGA